MHCNSTTIFDKWLQAVCHQRCRGERNEGTKSTLQVRKEIINNVRCLVDRCNSGSVIRSVISTCSHSCARINGRIFQELGIGFHQVHDIQQEVFRFRKHFDVCYADFHPFLRFLDDFHPVVQDIVDGKKAVTAP